MTERELKKAILAASDDMSLEMPWAAWTNLEQQKSWLSKHLVLGHFSPPSIARVSMRRESTGDLMLVNTYCNILIAGSDPSYRLWFLSGINELVYPGDVLHWAMTDQFEGFCLGKIAIN